MARRRRGRRSGGKPKPPNLQQGMAPAKGGAPTPDPASSRNPAGRGRPPRPSQSDRVANWIENFPPAAEEILEFLNVCVELRASSTKREAASLSEEELFYWMASGVETLAEDELDKLFEQKYREPLAEIRTRNQLEENKYWKPDDPAIPEDYRDLLDAFRGDKRSVLAEWFEKYNAQDIADLVRNDYPAYLSQREEGKRQFFARDPLETMRIPEEIKAAMEAEQST